MNINKAATLLICIVGCADLSCVKINSSGLVVPVTLQATLTVSAGGTLRFVSHGKPGAYFQVHFTPSLGCNGNNDDLKGTPTHAAVCKVPAGSEGLYEYTIMPLSSAGTGAGGGAGTPPPTNYVTVDHCSGCDWKSQKNGDQKLLNVPTTSTADGGPGVVTIVCGSGNKAVAQTDPVKPSAGQAVQWSQLGSDNIKWTVTVPNGLCSNGNNFGTVHPGTPQACIIDKNASPAGNPYPYTLTLTGCSTAGSAHIEVQATQQ